MNTNNIAKAVQATKIEEKKFEYNKLKNQYESLPERIKNAEMDYYEEGGCNLNDPSDTKRCGLEYYLEIKEDERRKALESFKNKEKENDLKAEEFTNFSFFDHFKLNNLFNKTVEGMAVEGSGENMTCNWKKNMKNFAHLHVFCLFFSPWFLVCLFVPFGCHMDAKEVQKRPQGHPFGQQKLTKLALDQRCENMAPVQ